MKVVIVKGKSKKGLKNLHKRENIHILLWKKERKSIQKHTLFEKKNNFDTVVLGSLFSGINIVLCFNCR